MQEVVIGIGGAAGDGLDKSGDTLARTAGRLGLHVYAYNSYQSIVRGGHIWLTIRISEKKVRTQGNTVNALVALNQDAIERHAGEIEPGGAIVFNSDRLKAFPQLIKEGVQVLGIPMGEVTKPVAEEFGAIQPIMQNTVAVGAILYLVQIDPKEVEDVIEETFRHKGQKVVDLNIGLLKAGYEYAKANSKTITEKPWTYTRIRRPFITGNEAMAISAVTSGCKFYSAYPMTPASTILHWLAAHSEKVGVAVKQCEDELSVINMAIGAGIAGVRSMCATSGGGFALMTEAVGMAGIMEVPVVCVEVQRGGPSTGLPTKQEQGDLNQVYGASQGDFPRMIVAPKDTVDAFYTIAESFNMAERFQMPVLVVSDLLLSEHPETVDPDALVHNTPIERGEIVTAWNPANGKYKRYAFTKSGVSPRAFPGTENTLYVTPSDDHDEESILISDMFTSPPMRRKIQEKRQNKMEGLLNELPAPQLEGPADAEITLVGWGSTYGLIRETAEQMTAAGTKTNYLIIKYILPFHTKEVSAILSKCKKKIGVEINYTGQMMRHIRAETGISMDAVITSYDGELMSTNMLEARIKEILAGKSHDLNVTEEDAREMAYHYLRTHHSEKLRPAKITRHEANGHEEPTFQIDLVERVSGEKQAEIEIGIETGSTYSYKSLAKA
jgi:2-oxoglutarate ferredoxin oxidoreductase subunit alpha